jgi:hypothetical protein
LVDAARFFLLGRVFGEAVPLRSACPWISAGRMTDFFAAVSGDGQHTLQHYGVDAGAMQARITAALKRRTPLELQEESVD